jgi:hypothetical protein
MLHLAHGRLETLSKQNKTMAEVIAANPLHDLDDKWGRGVLKPEQFLSMAYPSIARHHKKS